MLFINYIDIYYIKTESSELSFQELLKKIKKRVCIRCVLDNNLKICSQCKEPKENHEFTEINPLLKWNAKTFTKAEPTNAYGEIKFPSCYLKKAKVIFPRLF